MAETTQKTNDKENIMAETTQKTNDKVKVTIPRARNGEPEDLFVGINGVNYRIPKGKAVEVPDFVAAEIERSQAAEDFMLDAKERMLANEKA